MEKKTKFTSAGSFRTDPASDWALHFYCALVWHFHIKGTTFKQRFKQLGCLCVWVIINKSGTQVRIFPFRKINQSFRYLSLCEDQMLCFSVFVSDELLNSAFGPLTKELPVVFLVALKTE